MIITYVEMMKIAGKFTIIWNYIEIVKVYKFILSVLKFNCIYKYTPDKNDKTK